MMLISCPHCGPRAQAEFVYERTMDSVVRIDAGPDIAMDALFTRGNRRGLDEELWRHTFGCRAWLVLRRHRLTNVIESAQALGPEALP